MANLQALKDVLASSAHETRRVPVALLAACLDFIVRDSNPREHDPEREIDQLRIYLK